MIFRLNFLHFKRKICYYMTAGEGDEIERPGEMPGKGALTDVELGSVLPAGQSRWNECETAVFEIPYGHFTEVAGAQRI